MKPSFYVEAVRDSGAGVWISNTDIPGLVIEAATLREFEQLVRQLGPEMLALNLDVPVGSASLKFQVGGRAD